MNNRILAMFMVFLIIGSNFVYALDGSVESKVEAGVENTAEALSNFQATDIIINVDSYQPTVLSEQAFESDQPGGYAILATLTGMKTNPLMDLQKISSINFKPVGLSTKYVKSIYPKKAKSGYFDLDNLGYMVIRLQKLKEDEVPKQLDINISATIKYEIQNGFGINEQDMILPILTEDEFLQRKSEFSFWGGRGAVRLDNIRGSTANLVVYDGQMHKTTFSVNEKDESNRHYLSGGTPYMLFRDEEDFLGKNLRDMYKIKVNTITGNKDIAKVEMTFNGEYKLKEYVEGQELYEGSNWKIKTVDVSGSEHKVELYNDETNERLLLKGGQFYVPTVEEIGKVFEVPGELNSIIEKYSKQCNVDPNLVKGLINQEGVWKMQWNGLAQNILNQYSPDWKTKTGISDLIEQEKIIQNHPGLNGAYTAYGYGQIIHTTGEYLSKKYLGSEDSNKRFYPDENIHMLSCYLSELISTWGNERTALEKYTGGSPDNYGEKNKEHINNILSARDKYKSGNLVVQGDVGKSSTDSDTFLNEYSSIKVKLDALLAPGKTFSDIEPVLEEYKNFLDGISNQELFNKYYPLVFNDVILKLAKNYGDNPTLANQITDYFSSEFRQDYIGKSVPEIESITSAPDTPEYYYNKAIEHYREVVTNYIGTTFSDGTNEKNNALEAQKKIAEIYDRNLKDNTNAIIEYKKLIELFSDSLNTDEIKYIESTINRLELTRNYHSDTVNLFDNGNTIQLKLYGGEESSKNDKATINVNGNSKEYSLNAGENVLGSTGWYLVDINVDWVKIAQKGKDNYENIKTLRLNKREALSDGAVFMLEDVNIQQQAHITILPGEERLTTQTNFMLHIPVEPRLWKLSTEQMNKHIDATQKTIDFLDKSISIVEGVYKVWSIGCYGTFIYLWIKNSWFSSILGNKGDAYARKEVMNSWKEKCQKIVSSGKDDNGVVKNYKDLYDCIIKEREKVEGDLEKFAKTYSISDPNKRILELAKQEFTNENLNKKYDEEAFGVVKEQIYNKTIKELTKDKKIEELSEKELINIQRKAMDLTYNNLKEDKGTLMKKEGENGYGFTEKQFEEILKITSPNNIIYISDDNKDKEPFSEELIYYEIKDDDQSRVPKYVYASPNSKDPIHTIIEKKDATGNVINDANGKPIYGYVDDSGKFIEINPVKIKTNTMVNYIQKVSLIETGKFAGKVDKISVDSNAYLRVSKRGGDGEILEIELWKRYSNYGSETNLPLNIQSAYRVREPFTLENCNKGFTSERESVDYIRDLEEEYSGLQIACRDLITMDRQIDSKKYQKGSSYKGYAVEYAVQETGGLQCFDIMSINDCLALFSACDPVMCPASRFTAGGKWRVDSVVSTGIFGSIFLGTGLWRAKPIPEVGICVPGIDAGLKNLKSLFQGYQECLIARRDKGENIGICDTIRGVGVCKIIWREGTAFFSLTGGVMDKLIGTVAKASGRGGEYSYFKTNMQRTSDFMSFFTKEYAESYFSAYRGASTDEIGEQLCEAAIYAKVPGVGGFLDQLTKPEGPVQFIGWFSEMPSSELGGELINDYEVYYHIYAGEDRETVKYYVYLTDVDGILPNKYITTTTGYLKRGDFVDETKRIQERNGYDELCIVIDNKKNCGFGKVSSDLLIDYMKDKNLEAELNKTIKNEQECRGGSSVLSDPSVSEFADALYPGINKLGILRVCSKDNPGRGVNNPTWKNVGTCGTNSLGQDLGSCWLSKQSYIDALSEYDLERRKNAESLFKELTENLISNEEIIQKLNSLILSRNVQLEGWRDIIKSSTFFDKKGMINEILMFINGDILSEKGTGDFEDLKAKTIDINLIGKIEYEIGNTYYELAKLLEMNEIKKKAETQKTAESTGANGEATESINNLKYKIEFVDSTFLISLFASNPTYIWDGTSWKGKLNGKDININDYENGLNQIVNSIDSGDYISTYEELKIYCGNNKVAEKGILDLSKTKRVNIFNEIKTISGKCNTAVEENVNAVVGNKCNECGNGLFNQCDKEECKSLADYCVFVKANSILSANKCEYSSNQKSSESTTNDTPEGNKLSVEINPTGGDKVTGNVYAVGDVVMASSNLIVEVKPNFRKLAVSSDNYAINQIETINICSKDTCSSINKQDINPAQNEEYDFDIGIPEEEGFYEPFHYWDKFQLKIPSDNEQSYIITPLTSEEPLINNQANIVPEVSALIVEDENGEPVINQQVLVIEGNKILDYRTNNKGMIDLTKPEENPCNIYNDENAVFGKQYGCYIESECRIEYIKDSSDCNEDKVCCRPKCENIYRGYECVNTGVYACKSEAKKYYCLGDSSMVCCEKGSKKQETSEYSIVVSLSDVKLNLYKGNDLIKSYPIIVGEDCDPNEQRQCELSEGTCNEKKTKSECIKEEEDTSCYWDDTKCVFVPSCTPVGEYEICEKVENKPAPRWDHPKGFNDDKGNPFGARWHRLCEREEDLIFTPFGIHGTSNLGDQIFKMRESSIGKGFLNIASNIFTDLNPEYASHGCIRMSNENILDLYKYTKVGNENSLGTRVTIIYNS